MNKLTKKGFLTCLSQLGLTYERKETGLQERMYNHYIKAPGYKAVSYDFTVNRQRPDYLLLLSGAVGMASLIKAGRTDQFEAE